MDLKIKKVKDNAKIPKIATSGAAGMDLYACITEKITVEPQKIAVIPTGIAIELPNASVFAMFRINLTPSSRLKEWHKW